MGDLRRTRKSRRSSAALLLVAAVAMSLLACLITLPVPVCAGGSKTLRPNGNGTYTEFENVIPDNIAHWEAVDETSADGDTSYITSETPNNRDTFALSNPGIPLSSTVNSVTVYVTAKKVDKGQDSFYIMIRSGDTDSRSDALEVADAYDEFSHQWTANPADNQPWTVENVNALEAGVQVNKGVIVTQIYVVIDYIPFNFLINASPDSLTVQQGSPVSTTIHVTLTSGLAETVSLTGTWVGVDPGGITLSFSPPSGSPDFDSTLTFQTTAAATVGTFTYRVIGECDGLTQRTDVELEITELIIPAAPTLISPENGITIDKLTPTFDWADVAGAISYTLKVATDNNFSNIVYTQTTIESTATISETEKLSYGIHYYWRVRGTNAAGSGDWSPTWSFTAKLTAPKVLSFEINAGSRYTNSTSVELTISALNAVEMQFSNDGVIWGEGEWESYATSKSYTLSAGEGTKNVYIKVRDSVGDIGQPSVSSIILDRTSPSTTHSLSGDLDVNGYKGSVVVTLNSTDVYGVESTRYRIDNDEWQTGSTFVISSEGEHTIEYYSTDAAGNEEQIKSLQVKLYTPTTFPLILLVGIFSIIAAAVVVTSLRLKPPSPKKRLKMVMEEKKEALRLKKEAAVKYFKNGSISRGTYDELMRKYDGRMAELEEKERVLRARIKKKVKKTVKKHEKKKPGEATERLQSIKKRIGRV
ncbi:MAG: OmpL47-type beta-barrel domain-containing protein [Candidatus Hadarchaeaceae archaeon]